MYSAGLLNQVWQECLGSVCLCCGVTHRPFQNPRVHGVAAEDRLESRNKPTLFKTVESHVAVKVSNVGLGVGLAKYSCVGPQSCRNIREDLAATVRPPTSCCRRAIDPSEAGLWEVRRQLAVQIAQTDSTAQKDRGGYIIWPGGTDPSLDVEPIYSCLPELCCDANKSLLPVLVCWVRNEERNVGSRAG
jgi:hypothetical protein